ncbi:hypothetical protein [Bordetella genomosp. 9]|uniref:hypothetical protein n=1 Tax=Bordetella genomosp. 9 TaxID=1416803 RepID=UPI0012FBC93E|nr:hypothetical protein [Bordetella genomosp. 9]
MTPADKPDLPPKRPAGVDETMEDLRSAFIDVTLHAQRAITLCEYIELLEREVADERRKAFELAAAEAEHWQTISTTPGHACGQYIAAAIRALIDKEPTK